MSCRLSILFVFPVIACLLAVSHQQLGFKERCGGENEEESAKCSTNQCQEIEMDIDDMGGFGGDEDYSDYSDDDEQEPAPRYECVCPSYWHEFEKTTQGEHICERGGIGSYCNDDVDCSYGVYNATSAVVHTTFFFCDKVKHTCNCRPRQFFNTTSNQCQASQHMKPCSTHSAGECAEGGKCIHSNKVDSNGKLAAPYCNCTYGHNKGSCILMAIARDPHQCNSHENCRNIEENGYKYRNFHCKDRYCKCLVEPIISRGRVTNIRRWIKGDKVVLEDEKVILCARFPEKVGDICRDSASCQKQIKGHAECHSEVKRCACKLGYLESPSGKHCYPAAQHQQRSLWQWFWGHTSKYATSLYFNVIDTASSYVFKSRDAQVDFDGKFHFYRGSNNRRANSKERALMREGAPIDTLFHCDFGVKGAKNCSIATNKCSPTLTNKNSTTSGVLYPTMSNDYYMHADATNAAKVQASFNCQLFLPLIKSDSQSMCLTFEYLFQVTGAEISICRGQGTSVGECKENIEVNNKMTTWLHASIDVEYIENSKIVISFDGLYEAEKGMLAVDNIQVLTGKCADL